MPAPDAAPAAGYVWIGIARGEFETDAGDIQAALQYAAELAREKVVARPQAV